MVGRRFNNILHVFIINNQQQYNFVQFIFFLSKMEEQFKIINANSKKAFLNKKKYEKQLIDQKLKMDQSIIKIQSHIRKFITQKKIHNPFFRDTSEKLLLISYKKYETEENKFSRLMSNAIYKMPFFFAMILFLKQTNFRSHKKYIKMLIFTMLTQNNACIQKIFKEKNFQLIVLLKLVKYSLIFYIEESKINTGDHKTYQNFFNSFFLECKNQNNQKFLDTFLMDKANTKLIYQALLNQKFNSLEIINYVFITNIHKFECCSREQLVIFILNNPGVDQQYLCMIAQRLVLLNIYQMKSNIFAEETLNSLNSKYQNLIQMMKSITYAKNFRLFNVILFLHNFVLNTYNEASKNYICEKNQVAKYNSKIYIEEMMRQNIQYKEFLTMIPAYFLVKILSQSLSLMTLELDKMAIQTSVQLKIIKNNIEIERAFKNILFLFQKIYELFSDDYSQILKQISQKHTIQKLYWIIYKLNLKNINFTTYKSTFITELIALFIITIKMYLSELDDIQFMDQSKGFNKDMIYNTIIIVNRIVFEIIIQTKQKQTYLKLLQNAKQLISDLYNKNFRTKYFDEHIFEGHNLQNQLENCYFNQNNQRHFIEYLTYVPFSLSFNNRFAKFQQMVNLDRGMFGGSAGYITINRNRQIEDAFNAIYVKKLDLKKRFQVMFINSQGIKEDGIDGGGLTKQFITRIIKRAFNPQYGLFIQTSEKQLLPNPYYNKQQLEYYEFIGSIVGKAIYQGIVIQPRFSGILLNSMIGIKNQIQDLRYLDLQIYKNVMHIKHMKENASILDLTFSFNQKNNFGKFIQHELIPNGKKIAVNDNNKEQFLIKFVDYKVNKQFHKQNSYFRKGFNKIIKDQWLQMFNHNQIYQIISGNSNVFSIQDLKQHCIYGQYTQKDITIKYFWQILQNFTPKEKQLLLLFVTSCSRPPTLGFKYLFPPFRIVKSQQNNYLPTAHTCVNTIRLPNYKKKDVLKQKLLFSIKSQSGFEFA